MLFKQHFPFLVMHYYTFCALISSDMVFIRLAQNSLVHLLLILREHVTQTPDSLDSLVTVQINYLALPF